MSPGGYILQVPSTRRSKMRRPSFVQMALSASLLLQRSAAFVTLRHRETNRVQKLCASSKRQASLRLERILSNRGKGSRSEAGTWIKQGRVKVYGLVCKAPSKKFLEDALITLDGKPVERVPLLMAFHKPLNVLTAMGHPSGRATLLDYVPPEWRNTPLHPVGRLDYDTTGLLLFSREGALTQRLLHPSGNIEREYLAQVEGDALREDLRETLAQGVLTADGTFPARLLEQKENQVRVVVTEGKYRMVRRILANAGLPVKALHRVRYGEVVLESLNLEEGCFCEVPEAAVKWAERLIS